MKNRSRFFRRLAVPAAVLLATLFAAGPSGDALSQNAPVPFPGVQGGSAAPQCKSVLLKGAATGAAIIGPEDVDYAPGLDALLISAFDRWALEDALEQDAGPLPQGGIYRIAGQALTSDAADLQAEDLTAAFKRTKDFHPHGMSVLQTGPAAYRLFVINHVYDPDNRPARQSVLEVFDLTDASLSHVETVSSPELCQSNDVIAVSATEALVTRDRGACSGWRRKAEDILGLHGARVLKVTLGGTGGERSTVKPVIRGIAFANGIGLDRRSPGTLYVASTRGEQVLAYDLEEVLNSRGNVRSLAAKGLDGGPDNLSVAPNGDLIVAVHPSLLKTGLARFRWFGIERSPSSLVRLDARSGDLVALFEDAEGERFSTATSAVEAAGSIVAGSVLEDRLLVCKHGG